MNNVEISNVNFPLINNFYAYKQYVLSIPNLSEEEEQQLLKKFKLENCLKSAHKLIMSQLKTVIFLANQYKNYGLPEEDLVQEGNIGLIKAIKNFDIKYKVRLYTYALIWIKAEIQSFILKNWKIVKIGTTKNLKKLFFNFKNIQKEMIDLNIDKSKLIETISQKLNVSKEEVKEMENYFSNSEVEIDLIYDDNKPVFELIEEKTPETLYIEYNDVEKQNNLVKKALNVLNEKQFKVIKMRYYLENKKTHKEIAKILGISSERVRQIENEALLKLRKELEK
jgi:RNA polymerase sigma-32 factor